MLILFGSNGSGSAAIELALQHCGLPYRVERASTWEADSAQAALASANPMGQIPTLQFEDGMVMTESAAILIHLGFTYPESSLLPAAPGPRAQAIRGLVFLAANCYSAISVIDYPERWCADCDEATAKRIRAGTRERLHKHWEVFADEFAAQPFLHGDAPGALDYLAAVVSRWSGARSHLQQARPAFFATMERVQLHPTVAPVFAKHWPAP